MSEEYRINRRQASILSFGPLLTSSHFLSPYFLETPQMASCCQPCLPTSFLEDFKLF